MKKVGIRYEFQEGKMIFPPIVWPQRCPCCGSEQISAQYLLNHRARYTSTTVGRTTTSTYFPLHWSIPYCEPCKKHAHQQSNLAGVIILLDLLLMLALLFTLASRVNDLLIVVLLAGSILAAVILYQILLRLVVFPKLTEACTHSSYAVTASDDAQMVFFHFYRNEHAELFAQLNHSEAIEAIKPSFWSLKRK